MPKVSHSWVICVTTIDRSGRRSQYVERKKYRNFEEALAEAHTTYNFHKYFGWDGEENPNFDDSMISLYDKKNKIEIPYSLLKERSV